MSTVLEMKTEVKRIFGDESGSFLEDADLLRWFNAGQLDICRHTDALVADITSTTTAAQNYVTAPTDVLAYIKITLALSPLNQYPLESAAFSSDVAVDVPRDMYGVWNSRIYFNNNQCIAAQAYAVLYTRRPALLTADGNIPEIPVVYHEDLVRYALARAKEMEEDYGASDRFMADYISRTRNTRSDVNLENRQVNNAVRCLDEWDY